MQQSNRIRPTLLLVRSYAEDDAQWNKRILRVQMALDKDVEIVLMNKKGKP